MSITEILCQSVNRGWVVEFSQSQMQMHVETVEGAVKKNLKCIFQDRPIDYIAVGFFDTYEQALNAQKYLAAEWVDKMTMDCIRKDMTS